MPRHATPDLTFTVNSVPFAFSARALDGFPDARAFLAGLLERGGVGPSSAKTYVMLAARLKRQGRINDVALLTNVTERTAANAYKKWRTENYSARLTPVARALGTKLFARKALLWLRCHSLVGPTEGKTIPRYVLGTNKQIEWVPSSAWTLHVPEAPELAHQDPCQACIAIELDDVQLAVIAEAFEKAWGHRDLNAMPASCFLFGEPIAEDTLVMAPAKAEKTIALAAGTTAEWITSGSGARVTSDVSSFLDRLREGAEGVYLSKELCAGRLEEVLGAVRSAWSG